MTSFSFDSSVVKSFNFSIKLFSMLTFCLLYTNIKSNETAANLDFIGGLCVTRTHDQRIKSPMLYQLS